MDNNLWDLQVRPLVNVRRLLLSTLFSRLLVRPARN